MQRNERAVSSAIDSATDQKLDAEEKLDAALSVVADGKVIDVNKVLELRQTIQNADATIAELTAFKDEFFAEVPGEEDDAPAQ